MTAEERQRKKEERARLKVERAERRRQRRVQLSALGPYYALVRNDISSRATPQEFFLFWARSIIKAMPLITSVVFSLIGFAFGFLRFFIVGLPMMIIGVIVLAILCPPLLALIILILTYIYYTLAISLMVGGVFLITLILMSSAVVAPVFLGVAKRRINDLSKSEGEAGVRFSLFLASVLATPASLLAFCILACLSVYVESFGAMLGPVAALMVASLALLLQQLHCNSFRLGVKGENFAGANPLDVPITDASLAESGMKLSTGAWQVLSFVLIGMAGTISIAIGYEVCDLSRFIVPFHEAFPLMIYPVQALAVAASVFFVLFKGKYRNGDLCPSDIASVNACFKPRIAEVTDDLREQVLASERAPSRALSHGFTWLRWLFKLSLLVPAFLVLCELLFFLPAAIVFNSPGSAALIVLIVFGGIVGYHCFNARIAGTEIDWRAICRRSAKQMVSWIPPFFRWLGRLAVAMFRPPRPPEIDGSDAALQLVMARKRMGMCRLALFDPLGIHQFYLRQSEMGGIQLFLCFLIVGFPISWIWSILDAIRYSRMSNEEFLCEYPDYCVHGGMKDVFVGRRYEPSSAVRQELESAS